MVRQIINIDEEKCNGCGICVTACHEGAIDIIDGKAKLVRENFCDGLGDCLPGCPVGAITFENREAPAYDEAAVLANKKEKAVVPCGCPGSAMMKLEREVENEEVSQQESHVEQRKNISRLNQWPCQIKLVPVQAPFFDKAKLLIAADCSAYAYANIHEEFMKGKVTLIGCPKLDEGDYSEKLMEIISLNDIKSVTIIRMEVPCCGGLQRAAEIALKNSNKFIPWQVVTISRDGKIVE